MKINKTCTTCKFNFSGTCAAHESFYGYGGVVTDRKTQRDCWDISIKYYGKLLDTLSEDEIKMYEHSFSLSFDDLYYRIENGAWKPKTRRKSMKG